MTSEDLDYRNQNEKRVSKLQNYLAQY